MTSYKGAMYQNDVMLEFSNQADVFFYGPGFPQYKKSDDINEIIVKSGKQPDCIVLGHAWLEDKAEVPVDQHEKLNLPSIDLPKIVILNKEYLKLEQKLEFCKKNHIDIVFTHHHDVETYSKKTEIQFIFWPFAFNHRLIGIKRNLNRPIDFAFSGVLQNLNENAGQTDIRFRIQKKLFGCWGDVPVYSKKKYRKYSIFWNAIPRRKYQQYLARFFGKYKYLTSNEYRKMQMQTKIYLNTLSPIGLVSTRCFENMGSRTLVFCEKSNIYHKLFSDDCYVDFRSDLSDFEEKLEYYLDNEEERKTIVDKAYKEVMANHTWEKRIMSMIDTISQCL